MRGARTSKDPAPHLLAALDHATGAVLTQQRVVGKSNEIPALRELLEPLDLDGVVVSADAMHTQVDHPAWWSLPSHASGQPEDSAQGAQGPALEERPIHLLDRYQSWAAGAAYCQGRRGSRLDGLPRSRSGGPGPTHQDYQEQEAC